MSLSSILSAWLRVGFKPGVQVFTLPVPLVRVIGAAVVGDALHTPAIYAFLDWLKTLGQSLAPHFFALESPKAPAPQLKELA